MSKEYAEKLGLLPQECACDKCKLMCHAPCCGSVEDFEKIVDAGFADRLMFDDLPSEPDGGDILKPALKGYEGGRAPWAVSALRGCTFWNKEGKCDLHDLGLKPIQGKLAIHEKQTALDDDCTLADIMKPDWESERGKALIEKWKKLVNYDSRSKHVVIDDWTPYPGG